MSDLLIQPSVLTQVWTTTTPDGTVVPPPVGSIILFEGLGKAYRFIFWNDATTANAGDAAFYDPAAGNMTQTDQLGTGSTGLDLLAGIHIGAPTEDDYAWIQILGQNALNATDAADPGVGILVETTTDLVLADSMKGSSGQDYLVKDQAIGTEPTYANRARALDARTTNDSGLIDGFVSCLAF